jgi:hypothetical protein
MEASREMLRRGTRRKASRIAARAEVTGIAGYRVLIRTPDQERAAPRRQLPDPHNLAHKMRGESQSLRQIRRGSAAETCTWNFTPKKGSLLSYERTANRRLS